MLVRKQNPVGIDKVLDALQNVIYTSLTDCCKWSDYVSYPRVYKNPKKDESGSIYHIPEHYTGDNEYVEVLYNDNHNATSFILMSDEYELYPPEPIKRTIEIVFQLDIANLYGDIPHRADEEARIDIIKAIRSFHLCQTNKIKVVTGFENVYESMGIPKTYYSTTRYDDMSDRHLVKFTIENILIPC